MNIDLEKGLEVCGNHNKYQYLLLACACLNWFCADFLAINFAVLIFYPEMQCHIKSSNEYTTCTEKTCCDSQFDSIKANVIYHNIITERDLYCEKTATKLIAVIYTLGVVVGAYLSSKYADIYGRRFVCMIAVIFFAIFDAMFAIFSNIPTMMISLFFMGIGSSGATMTSFVMVYEVIATNKRNLYGILINSCYGLAGLVYYGAFQLSRHWMIMCIMSFGCGLVGITLMILIFAESPRFLLAANKKKECLKALLKIANINGRRNIYMQHLKEEIFTRDQLLSLGEEQISKTCFKYKEISNILNNLDYTDSVNTQASPISKRLADQGIINSPSNRRESDPALIRIKEKVRLSKGIVVLDNEADKDVETNISNLEDNTSLQVIANEKDPGMAALCKYQSIRWSFTACSIIWVFTSYIYFGNSYDMKKEGTEIFINGYIMYSAEFISYLVTGVIMSIPFMGRVRTFGYAGAMVCLTGILYYFTSKLSPFGDIVLFVFRFCVTCIFTSMYTYSTEVYPTSIRSKGLGINLTFARLSTIVIALTIDYYNPYLIFATMGLIIFGLHFSMKETMGTVLLDQIEEITNEAKFLKSSKDKDLKSMGNSMTSTTDYESS